MERSSTSRTATPLTSRYVLKPIVFASSLVPIVLLARDVAIHDLQTYPFNVIIRSTGFWSLRFLCITVAITPVRRLTGWHPIIRFRRMAGLFSFFYGTVHLAAYLVLDGVARSSVAAVLADALRPFFAIGWFAFVLMVPLAATSTAGMIRRMGGSRWQALHRLVYPVAVASVLHTYWPFASAVPRYAVVLTLVLLLRFRASPLRVVQAFRPAPRQT
jgi:methionine sulfoxide reductase heme-binding subunit